MRTFLVRSTSFRNAGGTSRSVLFAGPFCNSTYPTSLPTRELMESGKSNLKKCFAKAYAATFSLVTIMIWSVGSITSRPAIMAAADNVLPAPKTPLMGQSVLLSSFFFLQCRIAQDSCGHVPANSRSKRSRQLLPWATKAKPKQPQPKQHTQHAKPGSGCGKRDVKRVVRNDVRQPANSLFKSPHTLRCSPPESQFFLQATIELGRSQQLWSVHPAARSKACEARRSSSHRSGA